MDVLSFYSNIAFFLNFFKMNILLNSTLYLTNIMCFLETL